MTIARGLDRLQIGTIVRILSPVSPLSADKTRTSRGPQLTTLPDLPQPKKTKVHPGTQLDQVRSLVWCIKRFSSPSIYIVYILDEIVCQRWGEIEYDIPIHTEHYNRSTEVHKSNGLS